MGAAVLSRSRPFFRRLFGTAVLAAVFAPAAGAGPGATSAEFLRLDVGARPAAMAGTFAGLADSADAVAYNPAGLARLRRSEASFMHNEYVQGVRQEWLAAAVPLDGWGTLAVSANSLSVSPFSAYDVNDAPAGKVSAADAAYGLAYAFEIGRGWSVGLGAQYLRSRLDDRTASAAAYDAGAHWRPWPALELGASVLHVGQGPRYFDESQPLPRTIKVGAAFHPLVWWNDLSEWTLVIERVSLLADASFPQGQGAAVSAGLEFAYGPLSVRGGGRSGDYAGPGYTLGMGVAAFRRDKKRPEIDFDYAFLDSGSLGVAHRAGVTVKFGESAARRDDEEPARWRWPWSDGKDSPRPERKWRQEKFDPIFFSPAPS